MDLNTIKMHNFIMNKDFKKLFGKNVCYYRKLARLTQEQLAEKLGVSANTVSYIERGKNALHFSRLPLLADALGIDVYKLFVFVDLENDPDALLKLVKTATLKEQAVIAEVTRTILAL